MNKLKLGDRLRILGFNCGYCAQQKFCHMGIICGKEIEIECIQPMGGPVTVKVGRASVSIGYGMFSKLEYEVIE